MKPAATPALDEAVAITRLTALWGLTEAGLGGVVHALRIPFTGIVVGSTAIILITLIAQYAHKRPGPLLRAMAVVLLIKATVSPHTPIPAFAAVAFQGSMAAVLFRFLPGIRLPALLLGMLALMEGVVQKFLVMTLLYGTSVWDTINVIGTRLLREVGLSQGNWNASHWLIALFVVYYGVGGVVVGWLAGVIPGRIQKLLAEHPVLPETREAVLLPVGKNGGNRRWPIRRFLPALLMLGMMFAVYWMKGSSARGLYVLLRTVVVLILWFAVVGPLLRHWLARLKNRKAASFSRDLDEALVLMPQFRKLAGSVWQETIGCNRFMRWYHFVTLLVVYCLIWVPPDAGVKSV